jgi:hypothetical protein
MAFFSLCPIYGVRWLLVLEHIFCVLSVNSPRLVLEPSNGIGPSPGYVQYHQVDCCVIRERRYRVYGQALETAATLRLV